MPKCEWCGRAHACEGLPKPSRVWCLGECHAKWMAAHPEEQVGWVRVGDLTPLQHAELKALLGQGEQA